MGFFIHNTITIFIIIIISVVPAKAQQDFFDTTITPNEKAVFAFFRAADTPPDYDFWLKSSKNFDGLSEKKQEEYLVKEMLRLGHGYGNFNAEKDLIKLKIDALGRYEEAKNNKQAQMTLDFFNNEKNKLPSFDYPFGAGFITLNVDQLNHFINLKLNKANDDIVREKVPYFNDNFDTTLEVHVKAITAKYDEPIIKNGIHRWIMLGEIGYIRCEYVSLYTHQRVTLWEYIAPWHEETYVQKTIPEEEKYPHPYDLYKD